jgi:HSP90 family molecular chaperone
LNKPLTPRQEQILLLLKRFDFMTRDQLRKYCRLGTVRNANRELLKLADYLNNVRDGLQSVYYLNKTGREYVECEKIRKKGGHVTHTVMRNEFWLYIGCPFEWRNEVKVSTARPQSLWMQCTKKSSNIF